MKKKILLMTFILSLGIFSACGKANDEMVKEGYNNISGQNYAAALTCFDQALFEGADAEMVYRGKGLAFMGAGEYERALSAFRSALSSADMFPGELEYDINYYMAVCYYKLGQYNDAIAVYDAIVNLKPKDAKAYYLRGRMKLFVKDLDGAKEDFDIAISFDKKNYGLYMDVYETMVRSGYQEDANQYLDVVLAADVSDISSYDKGRLCYYQGDYSRGCTYLETARQKEKQVDADLILLLGECYKKLGNYEFAAVIYSSYLDTVQDPSIYNQLGLCYVEQGNYEAALNAFSKGIDVKDNNTCMQTLMYNEIVCYEYMQDYNTAKIKLEEYMNIYDSNPVLNKEYAFLSTR